MGHALLEVEKILYDRFIKSLFNIVVVYYMNQNRMFIAYSFIGQAYSSRYF